MRDVTIQNHQISNWLYIAKKDKVTVLYIVPVTNTTTKIIYTRLNDKEL